MADTHTDWQTDTSEHPQFRARFNVARNSSGVTFEATVEMTWSGTAASYYDDAGEHSVDAALADVLTGLRARIDDQVQWSKAVDTYVPKLGKVA